jgi:hypothetical protein
MLQKIAENENVDYMLYDLSPNVGGLNEVILMSSDYFIVPTSPDYFCLQAIGSLKKNIPKWHKEIGRFTEDQGFSDHSFPVKNCPKFLGAIQQRYRPRNGKPASSFQTWVEKIRGAINGDLVPMLEKIDCVIGESEMLKVLRGSGLSPYDLAHISDFNSLIAISQQLSKPIFALSVKDIREVGHAFGHVENTMTSSRDNFLEVFTDLGKRVIRLTSREYSE